MASCWLGACILMSLEKYLDRPWELVLIFGCGGNELFAACFYKGEKLFTITFVHGLLLEQKARASTASTN
jgi:hypothetical protein